MADMTNFQCPACTGPLHFVGQSGKVECEYCGSSFTTQEIEAKYAKAEPEKELAEGEEAEVPADSEKVQGEWDNSGMSEDWGSDAEGMKVYNCKSCGAELICDSTTAATECPYCGNPTVMQDQFAGALRPEFMIPFKITKEQAIEAMKNHYKGKKLLPRAFSSSNHMQEIKGVYVPFWMYDSKGAVNVWFRGERVRRKETSTERIVETQHYQIHRMGSVAFNKIPVDASSKMPDEYMDSIEPFNYDELTDFSVSYLPGYMADKYDVSVDDCSERADKRLVESAVQAMRNTIDDNYDKVSIQSKVVHINRGKVHYALLPVWLLTTKFNGENFLFAINGQTGKCVSKLPVDKGLAKMYFAIYAAIISVILTVIAIFAL